MLNFEKTILVLKEYYNTFNKLPESKTVYNDMQIGYWLYNMRKKYISNELNEDEIKLLLTVPEIQDFLNNFKTHKTDKFDDIFEIFNEFYFLRHCLPNAGEIYYGKNIGNWFYQKKNCFKNGSLLEEQKKAFLKINLDLSVDNFQYFWINEQIRLLICQFENVENITINKFSSNDVFVEFANDVPLCILINTTVINIDNVNLLIVDYEDNFNAIPNIKLSFPFNLNDVENFKIELVNYIKELYKFDDIIDTNISSDKLLDERRRSSVLLWFKNYNLLKEYYQTFNRFPITGENYKEEENNIQIGSWLQHERTRYKTGIMLPANFYRLNRIGVPFIIKNSLIDNADAFEKYIKYHKQLPQNPSAEYSWLCTRRLQYRKGDLDQNILNLFYKLDAEYDVHIIDFIQKDYENEKNKLWNYMYDILADFVQRTGLSVPPYNQKWKNENLWSWYAKQKYAYRDNRLTENQIELLKNLDFDFSVKEVDPFSFDDVYNLIVNFIIENSRFPLKQDDTKLYRSISSLKERYNKNKLSDEQIQKLNMIKFPFDVWYKNYHNLLNDIFAKEKISEYDTRYKTVRNTESDNNKIIMLDFVEEALSGKVNFVLYNEKLIIAGIKLSGPQPIKNVKIWLYGNLSNTEILEIIKNSGYLCLKDTVLSVNLSIDDIIVYLK